MDKIYLVTLKKARSKDTFKKFIISNEFLTPDLISDIKAFENQSKLSDDEYLNVIGRLGGNTFSDIENKLADLERKTKERFTIETLHFDI